MWGGSSSGRLRGTPSRRPYANHPAVAQTACSFQERGPAVALLRTILALIIFVILAHLGLVYAQIDENFNGLTSGIFSLGRLLEIPAQIVMDALPTADEQRQSIEESRIYFIGFAAVGLYFVLFLLLGVGRR